MALEWKIAIPAALIVGAMATATLGVSGIEVGVMAGAFGWLAGCILQD